MKYNKEPDEVIDYNKIRIEKKLPKIQCVDCKQDIIVSKAIRYLHNKELLVLCHATCYMKRIMRST